MAIPNRRLRLTLALVLGLALLAAGGSSAGVSSSEHVAGSLSLNAALLLRSTSVPGCPLRPSVDQCVTRTSNGAIPGLGPVAATYEHFLALGPPACASAFGKTLAYPIRLTVASKGEIELSVAEATTCLEVSPTGSLPSQGQTFTIIGGTGMYAGASGSGTLRRSVAAEQCDASGCHRDGLETWTATLTVPGLDFDLTAPTLTGARSKTVKARKGARSAHVTYQVTAQDDRDGPVPATCSPKSGSRFKLGRTRVQCLATDSSANTRRATFVITVKRGAS